MLAPYTRGNCEKTRKENKKEISGFISAVAPCAQLAYRYIYAHLRGGPMMRNSGTPCFRALPSITHPRMVTPEPLTDTFRQTHSFRGPRRLREEGLNLPYISHIWPSLTPRIFLIRSPFWNKHSCWRVGASLIAILTAAIVEMLICTQ